MLFYIIASIVILVDQITKNLVRIYIDMNERFTWWGIEFTHIENSGMAGGLFPGYARAFGVVAVLFVIGIFYIRITEDWSGPIIDSSLGFLVGGAIGNGIDRLLFGQVTDFIVRSGGVLNVADPLEPGGEIYFHFDNGNHELINILDVEPNKLFAFTWPPKNSVRFKLNETETGCELTFKEFLHEVDEHTARDLTGWHVCLDVIEALLDGKAIENRESHWKLHYPACQELLQTGI